MVSSSQWRMNSECGQMIQGRLETSAAYILFRRPPSETMVAMSSFCFNSLLLAISVSITMS